MNIVTMIGIGVIVGVVIFNGYMIYDFVARYRESAIEEGIAQTFMQRILRAAKGSMTVLVLKIGTIFWSVILTLAEFGDLIAMPEIKQYLSDTLGARGASAVSLVFILICYFARIRKFSAEPVLK